MSGSPTTPERDTTSRGGAANVAVKCYANPGNPPVVDAVPEAALSALDVGCGAGDNARLLHQRRKLVDGITLSDTEAQAAGQWCRRDAGFLQLKQKFLAVSQEEVEARLSRHELLDNTVVF